MSCEGGNLCVDCQRELDLALAEFEDIETDECPDHGSIKCHVCTVEDFDC